MKIQLLFVLLILLLPKLHAQKEGSIKGIVKDTSSGQPLAGATVTVLQAKDSSLISFSRTNSNGFFSLRSLDYGEYRLLVTHIGYLNISRPFVLSATLPGLDFGALAAASKSSLLKEVTVTQEKPPVVIRNDTLEYNADRKTILQQFWGNDSFFNSRNLDVYINKIRGYLKEDEKLEIVTIKGIGYRFIVG